MDRMTLGAAESEIAPQVTEVALQHQLISRYTSFVAVEETVTRPAHAPLVQDIIANQAPHGTAWPGTATPAPLLWRLAGVMLVIYLFLVWRQRRTHHAAA